MRILGIDPGLNITGYGVIEASHKGLQLVEAGVVRSKAQDPIEARLRHIHDGLLDVLRELQPQVCALEQLYSHYERPRTAILMGHARGVICLAVGLKEIPLYHYAATHIKKMLTGNGRAPKAQIQESVCREFRLTEPPQPPDVADALAIALCHLFATRSTAHHLMKRNGP